ncbi:MAG: hypothetical protein WCD79_01870 [Chthoniobacteraceae bacterium]
MRDNHQGLPEIIAVTERDGNYFGSVGATVGSETRAIEFGCTLDCYRALKRILQMRPFDKMPGVAYRYFFVPTSKRVAERRTVEVEFRIEQGKDAKRFPVEIPETLAANLEWFHALQDFSEASHLRFI